MRTTCILSALTGRSVCLTLTSSSPTNKQCVAVEEAEDAVVDAARAVVDMETVADTEIVLNAAETVPIAVIVPSVEIALNAAETGERVVERVAARAVVAVVAAVEMLLPDVAVEGETVAAPSSSVWTTRRRSPPWDKYRRFNRKEDKTLLELM